MKFKRAQSIFLVLALVISLTAGLGITAAAVDEAYTGQTAQGDYTISTAAQLAALATAVNAGTTYAGSIFTLTSNIDLSVGDSLGSMSWKGGTGWTPIAMYTTDGNGADTSFRFSGTFDGAEHYINNITISKNTASYAGYSLFGDVGAAGVVKRLGVTGNIGSYRSAAGIVSYNYGTVTDCFSKVTVTSNGGGGERGSGGIVGHNEGKVQYCINAGAVSNAYEQAGGIVGYNEGTSSLIDHCYNVGSVSSATTGYEGAIAATNGATATTSTTTSSAGTITNCYYLTGSSKAVIGLDNAVTKQTATAFNANGFTLDSNGSATSTALIDALNQGLSAAKFITAALGAYPVLSWQSGYQWSTCNVTIASLAGFTAKVNGNAITGVNKLVAGTAIALSADAAPSGNLFTGFSATSGTTTTNLGGTAITAPYSLIYTVSSDTTLSASYVPYSTTALTISTRYGIHGKSTQVGSKTWQNLIDASASYSDVCGYMYTHGTDGWNIVAATQYVPISTILSGTLVPNNTDYIVASASDGQPSVIPQWSTLNSDLYFFPNATTSTTGGDKTGEVKVPSALALSWTKTSVNMATGSSTNTAAKALTAAAPTAYNSGSLRFVYGSTEDDYTNLTANTTIQGNRLWSGVVDISDAKAPTAYTGSIGAAPLADAKTSSTPYYSYGVSFDQSSQTASITASGLVPFYKNASDSSTGNYVGIAIPVPTGTAADKIFAGDNNNVLAQTSTTTVSGTQYIYYYWDYTAASPVKYIQFSFDGGTSVYEIAVDTTGIVTNALNFCGVGLSLDMLKAHPTTATYTMVKNGVSTPYTVTGITVSDILKYYATSVMPAALVFGGSSTTVYNCPYIGNGTSASPQYAGLDWSQAMIIWSQIDSTNTQKISSGLSSAVNGGAGNTWWGGLTAVTKVDAALRIKSADGLFADRFVSAAQLQEHETDVSGWAKIKTSGTPPTTTTTTYNSITGITLGDLLSNYLPNSSYVTSAFFSDSKGPSSTFYKAAYSGSASGLTGGDFSNGMLVWPTTAKSTDFPTSGSLSSALNGGSGMYWYNNVISLTVSMSNIATFSMTPSGASVVVTNTSTNATVSPVSVGVYVLPNGVYSYTVSASGYDSKTSSLTMADANQTVSVALTATQTGGTGGTTTTTNTITGYSGTGGTVTSNVPSAAAGTTVTLSVATVDNYALTDIKLSTGTSLNQSISPGRTTYTFVMPSSAVTVNATFDTLALTIYTQSGADGKPVIAARYSRAQLENLSTTVTTPTTGYIYYNTTSTLWTAVAATQYVTLDALLSDAGVSFASGDSISSTAGADGFNDTVSYDNLQGYKYYFDPNNNGASADAPYIIALKHYVGTLTGSKLETIASGVSPTTTLRSCYGCSLDQYNNKTAFGRRLVSSVTKLTIIQSAIVNTNTKDGVTPGTTTTTGSATVTAKPTVLSGVATATVNGSDIDTAVTTAAKTTTGTGSIAVEINAAGGTNVTTANVSVPLASMTALAGNKSIGSLKISTDAGNITFDAATISSISTQASGQTVSVSIGKADQSALTDSQKALAGTNTVYQMSISDGTKKISSLGSNATVTLPYTLSSGESAGNIAIYYLAPDGTVEKYAATYDATAGTVTFKTSHFSDYVVANESTAAFSDIKVNDWYYAAVNYAVKNSLMNGVSATSFDPSAATTRAMLLTTLWRLAGSPAPTITVSPFSDVTDTSAWYYKSVLWAYEKGITAGLGDGSFGTSATLSRQQMVTILYRYSQVVGGSTKGSGTQLDTTKFTDWGNVASWAADAFKWAFADGVVTGTSATALSPDGNATRGQIATILIRIK